jgi:hypothetical protein
MPVLPAVPAVVRADFLHTMAGGARAQFRKFFKYGGALSAADAQSWVNTMNTAWNTRINVLFTTEVTLNSVLLTDLSSALAPQALAATARPGTAVPPTVPNGVALVLKDKIARRYRGGHPRTYLMGMRAGNLTNANAWDPTFIGNLLGFWNSFISDILTLAPVAALPITEVNVSYFSGFTVLAPVGKRAKNIPSFRVGGPIVDTILSHSVNPKPGSQRRRDVQSA